MRSELNQIIIEKYRPDYENTVKRAEKSRILDEIIKITELDRKHIIKILRGQRSAKPSPKGRPKTYGMAVGRHILILNGLMEQIAPKRMKEAIPLWLPFYEKHYGLLEVSLRTKILNISSSSIGRILKAHRDSQRGKSTTRVSRKFKSMIPIKRLDEKVTEPGTVQADTVAHCGGSLLGDFANSLTLTDVHTNWTENRACWTKQSTEIKKNLQDIEKETPIIIKNFDTDCGAEFLNYRVMQYFESNSKRHRKVKMRRSRPYKKNDQCYVEQKKQHPCENSVWVR